MICTCIYNVFRNIYTVSFHSSSIGKEGFLSDGSPPPPTHVLTLYYTPFEAFTPHLLAFAFPFPSLVYTTAEVVVPPLPVSHNHLSLVCQTESTCLLNSQMMQRDDLPLRREDLQILMLPYMESWWFLGELAIYSRVCANQ